MKALEVLFALLLGGLFTTLPIVLVMRSGKRGEERRAAAAAKKAQKYADDFAAREREFEQSLKR